MADSDDSDSEVEFPISKKRKFNFAFEDEEDESNEDGEETGSDENNDDDDDDGESDEEDESGDEDDAVNDVDLADDVNNDQCSICLMEFADQATGVPNTCSHVFCAVCIQEWSKNINTCPVDRKVFSTIVICKGKDGPVLEKIQVEDKTQVQDEYEDPTACEVCGVGDREDRMLLCDGCDRGFHLECLTPPLDSVPEGEWFCSECFFVNPQSDTADDSQHEIGCSDDDVSDIPPEVPSSPVLNQPAARSRPSTSQRQRARTVATSRNRRRTQTQSSRRPARRRKTTKGKSSSKRGTSSRGTSTSSTRSKRKSKSKRRSKKSTRKTRKVKRKSGETNKSQRHRSDVSPSKYLLPHEMEPTSTFSLFGNDLDLEYLPVVEGPVRDQSKTQESEERHTMASCNPDVLGSIFTGLNTLHHKAVSLDSEGRLKVSGDSKTTQDPKKLADERTPSLSSSANERRSTQSSQETEQRPGTSKASGEKEIQPNAKNNDDNVNYEISSTRRFVNEKRIKRFDINSTQNKGDSPKTFNTIFGASRFSLEKSGKDHTNNSKSIESKCNILKDCKDSQRNHKRRSSKETAEKRGSRSLATYKIPRKKPISASTLSGQPPRDNTKDTEFDSAPQGAESKALAFRNKDEAMLSVDHSGFSRPGSSMHLSPQKCVQERTLSKKECRTGRTSRSNRNILMGSSHNSCVGEDSGSKSMTSRRFGIVNRNGCLTTTGRQVAEASRGTCSSMSQNYVSKTKDSNVSSSSSFKSWDSGKTNVRVKGDKIPFSDVQKVSTNTTRIAGGTTCRYSSGSSMSVTERSGMGPSGRPSVQTATNLQLIEVLNKQKSLLFNDLSIPDSSCSSQGKSTDTFSGSTVAATQNKALPPLRPIKPRPVAVVHPTKQGMCESIVKGEIDDIEAAKRRKEGIERIRRNQKISDEVKEALKSFYRHKEISREEYKHIFKRAVGKIRQSPFPVESRGVFSLVRNYVKKIKGEQMKVESKT